MNAETVVINTFCENLVKLNEVLDWKIHSQNKTNLHLVFQILFSSQAIAAEKVLRN